MAMWARAGDDERVLGADELISPQEAAEGLDLLCGPVRKIRESAFADLAFFAPSLAEEYGGG
jgi:hypothetical protein